MRDVIPTSIHVRLPFIMAYDLDVVGTLESKRRLLTRAADEKWLLVFGHDLDTHAAVHNSPNDLDGRALGRMHTDVLQYVAQGLIQKSGVEARQRGE